ncbi:hypothetical protein, partial [Acinetobacter baumannii]|uniref:hypothetical protein n=1 Tax=Acinetobacter baumannii TaxID=470 RepID=UPI0033911B76
MQSLYKQFRQRTHNYPGRRTHQPHPGGHQRGLRWGLGLASLAGTLYFWVRQSVNHTSTPQSPGGLGSVEPQVDLLQ